MTALKQAHDLFLTISEQLNPDNPYNLIEQHQPELKKVLAHIRRILEFSDLLSLGDSETDELYDDVGNQAFRDDGPDDDELLSYRGGRVLDDPELLGTSFVHDKPSPPDLDPAVNVYYSHEEANSQIDLSVATEAKTAHEVLLTPFRPLRLSHAEHLPSSRPPRLVELSVRHKLREVVYCPGLGHHAHRFLKNRGERENLRDLSLSVEQLSRCEAGLTLANYCKMVSCEGDTEYIFRSSHAYLTTLILNWIDAKPDEPFFPRKGVVSSESTGEGASKVSKRSHAYADVQIADIPIEVKQLVSIKDDYCARLLHFGQREKPEIDNALLQQNALGFIYSFSHPLYLSDSIDAYCQPLIQLWAQMDETKALVGQGTSHDFSFFVCKDPQYPERLYLSSCYSSSESDADLSIWKKSPQDPDEDYMSNGLYTMYSFFRIGTCENYHEEFMTSLRGMKLLQKNHGHLPVLSGVGTGIDLARGYRALPPAKQNRVKEALRLGTPKNYKDLSTSDVEVEPSVTDSQHQASKERKAQSLRTKRRTGAAKTKSSKITGTVTGRKTGK